MLAAVKDFTSASYDENFIANYKLELFLTEQGMLMAVRNQLGNPLHIAVYENPGELPPHLLLAQLATHQPMLQPKFEGVTILLNTDPWILAPDNQLVRGKEGVLFQTLFEANTAKDKVIRTDVQALKAAILTLVNDEMEQTCMDALPQFRRISFSHVVAPALDVALRVYVGLKNKPIASVTLLPDSFVYTVFDSQRLLFCNRFWAGSEADVLYYVMSVNSNLALDTDTLITYVTGYGKHRAATESLMQSQFKNYLPSGKIFPTHVEMADAGFSVDEYSFLLVR